ncbi:DUF1284 domain-containing protein [Acidihalobacter ferrooxydans]|uniref:DUF1284 domain-containing protein n=1 Tax=Acidihalobacter ferrooxydans TaxID=1765967 RepID=A0A1P8UH75_9GAMM|nr:DUF1284 domain-containing protein [Acidihalobacter ferrooxydans]APZ43196.1 hypothetical protein BW247_08910 [Acidihalobacter ferrooxydans]
MPAATPLRFRPHHFLCALGYQGKGYSTRFTANMSYIVYTRLRNAATADTPIEVVTVSDAICAPCPHRRGTGCERETKIAALDQRHAARLDLRDGQVIGWLEARQRIRERIAPDDLDTLCAGCEWLDAGMCKQAVAQLRDG